MRRTRIDLEKALKLESESLLILYFPSTSHNDLPDIPYIGRYTQNFIDAAGKYRKVDIGKLLTYIDPEYQIEVPVLTDPEGGFFEWAYLYGKSKKTQEIHDQALEKGQYVYVLVNPAYDFVKIGKAVNPQSRVKQINGAGTVSEWKLYWALPVTDDYRVEYLVHQHFADKRLGSDQGSDREFFQVTKEEAIEAILFIAEDYYNGDPTFY